MELTYPLAETIVYLLIYIALTIYMYKMWKKFYTLVQEHPTYLNLGAGLFVAAILGLCYYNITRHFLNLLDYLL